MKIILFFLSVLLLTGCKTVKEIPYLQNSADFHYDESIKPYDMTIRPKDRLLITVHSTDEESVLPFNLEEPVNVDANKNRASSYTTYLKNYLVDNNGTIEFPVLGNLKVGGLTKAECEKLIHDKIMPYLNAKENPVVTVRMANYKISVLGEVNRPGMFTVSNEKINIFEALAQAGDLTIYGVRDNVKLIRENAKGRKEIHTVVLNDASLINSPYYYLQQNDILYVEPNKVKARNSTVGQTTTLWFSATSILISMASLLYNILK